MENEQKQRLTIIIQNYCVPYKYDEGSKEMEYLTSKLSLERLSKFLASDCLINEKELKARIFEILLISNTQQPEYLYDSYIEEIIEYIENQQNKKYELRNQLTTIIIAGERIDILIDKIINIFEDRK